MVKLSALTMESLGLAPPKLKPGFFVDYRKGEVGELRLLLRKMVAENKCSLGLPGVGYDEDYRRRREILRRVIRCITLGMDVSRLYTDVVMISHTKDPVQKKMIYMFLSTYSKDNPDLTVLTINTLLKDVDSVDPSIRCLALRNLSAFDTPLSNDYAKNAVLKKVHDPSDSVKRSAIIGSLRVYKSQCALATKGSVADFDADAYRSDILTNIMSSLNSMNVDIMFDSMCVYGDMMQVKDDIKLSKPRIVYMINRIKQMSEWQQCLTLKLLHTYTPCGEELFDLLNLLDSLLKHTSSAVFLATAKCFLKWTAHDHMLQLEVFKRLEKPMIALLTQCCNEAVYNLLLNTLLLIVNAPKLQQQDSTTTVEPPFADHYELFFCRYDDPAYIKSVKLNILVAIACERNSTQIVNELMEYISDTNHTIATKSVKSIGLIAIKTPARLEMIIKQLSALFTPRIPYLICAVLYVICALLRAYPDDGSELLKIVEESKGIIKDPEALAHYIWILGEFGCSIDSAPYILEDIIDQPDCPDVTKELLCASMKLFFKRPPEMFPGLSRLFRKVMNESHNLELLNYANFYYNMLYKDTKIASHVIAGINKQDPEYTMDNMMVDLGIFLPREDWREIFNSLELLEHCAPSGNGYSRHFPFSYGNVENDIFTNGSSYSDSSDEDHDSIVGEQIPMNKEHLDTPVSSHERAISEEIQKRFESLSLVHPETLLSEEYQKRWSECTSTYRSTDDVEYAASSFNPEPLENMLLDAHIVTLASGNDKATTKIYQYAQDSEGHMYYIEVVVGPLDDGWCINVLVRTNSKEDLKRPSTSMANSICYSVKRWLEYQDCN